MHVHLPKPLHGWREFGGEVGIIVIGVLIALGAEQVVGNLHWRGEARDFRSAVNGEVDFNLAAYNYRVSQSRCVERRLAELDRWSTEQHAGRASPLLREIAYPLRVMPDAATWSSRSADLAAHIPAGARAIYSDLYSTMANVWELEEAERATWLDLNGFDRATKLSPDELIQLDKLIYRAKSLDRLLITDARWLGPESVALGVHASFGQRASSAPPYDPAFCEPIISGVSAKAS